jgi:hypothetical protein
MEAVLRKPRTQTSHTAALQLGDEAQRGGRLESQLVIRGYAMHYGGGCELTNEERLRLHELSIGEG